MRKKLNLILNEPGALLKEFHVIGKASPEGYYQKNLQLAQKRMQRIQQEVIGVLPHAVAERVLLFVYNRPEHVRRNIQALLKNELAAESELFIYSDAAKDETSQAAVKEVFWELKDEERLIVALSVFGGYTGEEIAGILEKNPSTIRSKYRRALKKMREKLEG